MYIRSPNISPGPGSVVKNYTEEDWVRTVRHGVSPSKHPLMLMPSKDYARMTDFDLASLVAYVRTLSPAVGEAGEIRFPLIVRASRDRRNQDDAEEIDHALPPPLPVVEGVTAHGATSPRCARLPWCRTVRRQDSRSASPNVPAAANLTPEGKRDAAL
jgi:hypothetical protein